MNQSPTLKHWLEVTYKNEYCLAGYVYNHPKKDGEFFKDGHRVITSLISHIDNIKSTCQTRNTLYNLEDENPYGGQIINLDTEVGLIELEKLLPKDVT